MWEYVAAPCRRVRVASSIVARGGKGVFTPLGSKGPLQLCSVFFFYYHILILLDTNAMICIQQGRAEASGLIVRDDKLSRTRRWARVVTGCRGRGNHRSPS